MMVCPTVVVDGMAYAKYRCNMQEMTLNDQTVLYDRDATVLAYKTIEYGGSNGCTCNGCKNFMQFRKEAYSPKLLKFLDTLGIDPEKEWEAYSWGDEIGGRIPYGGWFVFVGEWSDGNTKTRSDSRLKMQESFSFTDSFPVATQLFGPRTLAVEFYVEIPKSADYVSDFG